MIYLSDAEHTLIEEGHVLVSWCLNPESIDLKVLSYEDAVDSGYVWADGDLEVSHPKGTYGVGPKYKLMDYMVDKEYLSNDYE